MFLQLSYFATISIVLICPISTTDEIYVSPFINDVQNNINTVIQIKGLASTVDMVKTSTCNVMDLESRTATNTDLSVSNTFTVSARFDTPTSLGVFKIHCSELNFDGNFLLVNSLHLLIGDVEPKNIKLGDSVSFKLELFNLTEPVPLMCHLTDGEDYIILPTNSINGNKLSTWITCPEYKLNRAAEYKITAVYSTDAIDAMLSSNNFKVITVQADRPKVIKSGFTKDLRTLWFQFDQNVEGPNLCDNIFTSTTMSQIGYDAVCWFSADHLTVLLGIIKTVKDNKFTVQFSSNNYIRAYKSWAKLSLTMPNHEIVLPIISSEVTKPIYWMHGPRQFCNVANGNVLETTQSPDQVTYDCTSSQAITVSTVGSLALKYSQILSFNVLSSNSEHISTDESSDRTSLVRNSVRSLVIMINRQNFTAGVCLDSSLMLPHVEYTLELSGTNILNQSGSKSQLEFMLIDTHGMKSHPKLQIMARLKFAIGTEAIFETLLYPVCGEPLEEHYNNLQYGWYLTADDIKYNIIGVNGPVLILNTEELSRGKNYTIGCELYNEIVTQERRPLAMAKDEVQFGIESFDAKTTVVPQQIVVAFGRSIHLKTKHQNYVAMGDVQYKWLCKSTNGDDCFMTGNYPELREIMDDKSSSTSSELVIRELTLQPGRYYFVVQVSLSNIPIDSAVSVVVVSFEPGPHIMFYWPDGNFNPSIPLPPGSSFILAATISYLTTGCLTTWTTSSDSGYSYLTSKHMGGKVKVVREFFPGRNETFSRDVRLVVTLPNKVEQNTNILVKLNVHCASLKYSMFGIIPVSIAAPPRIFKLEVTPTEGISLLTKFKFYTDSAYDTKSSHPLRYSFGFYSSKLTTEPVYFYSSTLRLQTETVLPTVNSDTSKIKTILKVCNVYDSCNTIEGPVVSVQYPRQFSDEDLTYITQKYKRMLVKQMITESEAYAIILITTLKFVKGETYKNISQELYNILSNYINNVIESVSYGKEYIPIGLSLLDSISRTFFIQPELNNKIVSQSLVSLRDTIYTRLLAYHNTPMSSVVGNNIKYIIQNVNSHRQNFYSQTEINVEVVKAFLQVSETVILNQENPDSQNEKKKLLDSVENYAKHVCLTLNEQQEVFVGSLVGSFSVQMINSASSIEASIDIPTCNPDFHKKCIKQKSKVMINKNLFVSQRAEYPLCFIGFHFYDDFFTQVYSNEEQFLKRHSGLYGFHIMKMNTKGRSNYESVLSNPSNKLNIIEIPLQLSTDNPLECRYWNSKFGWINEGCKLLSIVTKSQSKFATCECPAFKYYSIFSLDVTNIPLDNSVSDSTHHTVVYDNNKNQSINNSSITQRSLSDLYAAFKVNGDPADFQDQNPRDLENSLYKQLLEKIKSLSSVMKELKVIMSDPIYVTLHLMQTENITTDKTIQDLVKKLADGSLILYDLHRHRLYVPEQPLRIMQPRNTEYDDMGRNIALFFAIFVAFLACFMFGSIILKRHQLLTDISDEQQNLKKEEDSIRRPRYKKLESTELIEQNTNSEQRFRHFNNNVELSDSGITLHSDRTQIHLLQQLR